MRCHGVPVHFLRASMLFTANPSLCDAVPCKAIAWNCYAVAYLFTATPLRFCARQCLCHAHLCPCDAPRFRRLSAPRLALAALRYASAVVCSAFPLPWLAIPRQCYASQSPCQSALTMPFLSKSFHCRRVDAPCHPLPCQYNAVPINADTLLSASFAMCRLATPRLFGAALRFAIPLQSVSIPRRCRA